MGNMFPALLQLIDNYVCIRRFALNNIFVYRFFLLFVIQNQSRSLPCKRKLWPFLYRAQVTWPGLEVSSLLMGFLNYLMNR